MDDTREFVIKCYYDVLKREPDAAGLEFHVDMIKNKVISKEQLSLLLKESEEYKQILKNNNRIMNNRIKIMKNKSRVRKVRYGRLSVSYTEDLNGGGLGFGQDFVPVVKNILGKVPRICEFGAGPGFIGFSLLAHGLCESLCLIDINPEAIKICQKTINENKLEDKVSVYLSDGLKNIPSYEKWDLVVSNPPHFKDAKTISPEWVLRTVDPDWTIHKQFYENVSKFLKPNGSVLFQENVEGSMPWIHSEMITKNNLELVSIFWHRKFDSLRYILIICEGYKEFGIFHYCKMVIKKFLKRPRHVFYFVWSKKINN